MTAAPIVYLTDRDLRPVTDPIRWTDVDAVDRHLYPGVGSVTCPAYPQLMEQLELPGRRAVLLHDGAVFLAGPIERSHGPYQWTAGSGPNSGLGQITWHFSDYKALAGGRRTYPDPTLAWAAQSESEDARYEATGDLSTVLLDLIDANAGPGAITARRIPRMVMGVDPEIGATVAVSTRFQWLMDEVRALVAAAGGGVGLRMVLDRAAREVTCEVYATVDRSATVRFARSLGNLRSVTYETETARVTAALVAGQGEGAARELVERVDSAYEAAGDRVEDLVDRRDSADTTVLQQAGDARLVEGGPAARLGTVTVDTPGQRYGTDYQLGDLAAVEPVPGLLIVQPVQAVQLQAGARTGVLLTSMVGSQAMARDPEWLRISRDLARRIAQLEAT